jgi:hypothetical protein
VDVSVVEMAFGSGVTAGCKKEMAIVRPVSGIKPRNFELHEFADENYMRINAEPVVHSLATSLLVASNDLASPA